MNINRIIGAKDTTLQIFEGLKVNDDHGKIYTHELNVNGDRNKQHPATINIGQVLKVAIYMILASYG